MMTIPSHPRTAPVHEAGDVVRYQAIRAPGALPVFLIIPEAPRLVPALPSRLELEYDDLANYAFRFGKEA